MSRDPIDEALFVDRSAPDPDSPVPHFVALQRVVVRMLFDPAFVARVYEDPGEALRGLDLDPSLVRQLLRNDRRLWNADRLRRSRSLKVLLEEFKVTSTLVLAERAKLQFLDDFFSSSPFHEAVQKRTYMALAFSAYLGDAVNQGLLRSPHLVAALGLETAMARSRRLLRDARRGGDAALVPVEPGCPGERWVVGPGILTHGAPAGTIALVQHIEKYLFQVSQVPALALCDDAPRPEPLPPLDEVALQPFLLEPRVGGKVDLSEIGGDYASIIAACARPMDGEKLRARLEAAGGDPADALDMAASLLEAGVLRRVRVDGGGRVHPLAETPSADPGA